MVQDPKAKCTWHIGRRGHVAGPELFAQEFLEQVILKASARYVHVIVKVT